jgi:hypothetical protein
MEMLSRLSESKKIEESESQKLALEDIVTLQKCLTSVFDFTASCYLVTGTNQIEVKRDMGLMNLLEREKTSFHPLVTTIKRIRFVAQFLTNVYTRGNDLFRQGQDRIYVTHFSCFQSQGA